MSERIVMRVGEALVAGGPAGTAAEPEVVIGELDGPVGTAFANLIGDQAKGHSKVLAIMNTDIMVRPATLMVSKVTVNKERYTNILMGTVQGAIANGVLDSVRNGDIPKEKEFTWNRTGGDPITQGNRNPLLYKKIGVDGIKTGFLSYEKYSLASSIKRNNRRLIAVGSGFETRNLRSKESQKLLTWGLTNFDTVEIAKKGNDILELNVWLGQKDRVGVYSDLDIYKTVKKARLKKLQVKVLYDGPIEAPIKKR